MSRKDLLKRLVIHPFLLGVFPFLFLFSQNINKTSVFVIILPLVTVVGVTALLLLFPWLTRSNLQKFGLTISAFLLFFFSYGHVFNFIRRSNIENVIVRNELTLFSLMGILFLSFVYFLLKTRRNIELLNMYMNVVSIFLVSISLFTILTRMNNTSTTVRRISFNNQTQLQVSYQKRSPDIYYLIFDRYGNADTLKSSFNFDNSEFITYLKQKGFYVADKSTSNYLKTAHSLASSLNMEYINFLTDKLEKDSKNLLPLYNMLKDYRVWRILKEKGYTFIHFGSWWDPTSTNPYADINYNLYPLPEFYMLLYRTTALYPLLSRLLMFDEYKLQWKRVYYDFEKLQEIVKNGRPTFVFAHILVPHDPYVFDKDGNYVSPEDMTKRSYRDAYVDQVIFINKKIKELVNTLLAVKNKKNHPIIIIQADEGFFPLRYLIQGERFDWRKATKQELKEKMSILNAYYLPGVDAHNVLYPIITPVNSFRLIFDLYFNTNIGRLPDKNYIFTDETRPYNFQEVTDKLKKAYSKI